MAEENFSDQEFVEYVVKAIVDHPESVKTERNIDEMGVLITLEVSPEDMGQVIGRQGQTAKSLRTLLRVIGAKNNARVNLKIIEPEGSDRGMGRDRREEKPRTEDDMSGGMQSSDDMDLGLDGPSADPNEDIVDDLKL